MKKLLILALILFIANFAFSQSIRGVLVDSETNLPIPYVAIGSVDYANSTVTNIEGEFELNSDKAITSFIVSHINYETNKLTVIKGAKPTYKLVPKTNLLDEIIVTTQPINQILLSYIEKSQAKLQKSLILTTYYREFVKADEDYTKYSDGILKYYIKNVKKSKADVEIIDARAIELKKVEEKVKESKEVNMDLTSFNKIQEIFDVADFSFLTKYCKEKEANKYTFEYRTSKKSNGDEYKTIVLNPKEEIDENLNKITIIIDAKNEVILDVAIEKVNDKFKEINFLGIIIKTKTLNYKIAYHYSKNNYYPSYVMKDILLGINANKKNTSLNDLFRFTSDVVVTTATTDYETIEKGKKYQKTSLYEREIEPKSEFWINNNGVVLTKEQQDILNKVNTK